MVDKAVVTQLLHQMTPWTRWQAHKQIIYSIGKLVRNTWTNSAIDKQPHSITLSSMARAVACQDLHLAVVLRERKPQLDVDILRFRMWVKLPSLARLNSFSWSLTHDSKRRRGTFLVSSQR